MCIRDRGHPVPLGSGHQTPSGIIGEAGLYPDAVGVKGQQSVVVFQPTLIGRRTKPDLHRRLGADAVSYTHLDVYQRQAVGCCGRSGVSGGTFAAAGFKKRGHNDASQG